MITIVTLSPRRFLVLDVERTERSYHAAEGRPGMGFKTALSVYIAGPVSWSSALAAASEYAAAKGILITADAWQKEGSK